MGYKVIYHTQVLLSVYTCIATQWVSNSEVRQKGRCILCVNWSHENQRLTTREYKYMLGLEKFVK